MNDLKADQAIDALKFIAVTIEKLLPSSKDGSNFSKKGAQKANSMEKVYQLRDGMLHQLEAKTSWGRVQLKEIILNLVANMEEEE